jgi:hypothetical protein
VVAIITSSIARSSIVNCKAVVASSQVAVTYIPLKQDKPCLITVNFQKLTFVSQLLPDCFSKKYSNRGKLK